MKRRDFIILISSTAVAALPNAVRAQRTFRIGFLVAGAAETSAALLDAFKQGLRENGMIEGRQFVLESRYAEGRYERFPEFAGELTRQSDVIVVNTIAGARAAQRATSTIPIIMATINDPVANGIVASLARPGGNITGMATLSEDVTPKLVDFLRAAVPKASAIAVIFNPTNPSNAVFLEKMRTLVAPLDIAAQTYPLTSPGELETILAKIASARADALMIVPDAGTHDLGGRIASFGIARRIPIMATDGDLTTAGGLMSYGVSRRENFRRAAYFVKKVLDGARPADLPVEQPTRILLSINLKTARAIGINIPPTLLATADEVIE